MGKLIYEGSVKVDIDDRALLHVQTVIGNKLRRGEPFLFTWREDTSTGGGRTSIWLHPGCSLVFKFYGSRTPEANRNWLEALMFTANSPGGLHLVPEPSEQSDDDKLAEHDPT